jgi:hypothetical protein
MKKSNRAITRRDFLKGAGATALGVATLGLPVLADNTTGETTKSRIVLVRNQKAVADDGTISGEIIQEMLDEAMLTLMDKKEISACWKEIIDPEDRVGIKNNVWRYLPTTTQVEQAIKKRIMDVGVPEDKIGIDDRGVLYNSRFTEATALINARPMRTHAWSGVGSLIKNYIMFVDRPDMYHGNACADLGAIWNLPIVKGKTRLNVLVMLTPQFHNAGPHHFDKEYTWDYGGLIVGTDPVACDTIGLKIIQAKRKLYFKDDRPIKPVAHHIMLADTRHHLGTSDLEKIDLIQLGWKEDSLL